MTDDAIDWDVLDAFMRVQAARVREDLDRWERRRGDERRLAREKDLSFQAELPGRWRGRLQWFVGVYGVGHGSREGLREMPDAPVSGYTVHGVVA